MLEGAPLDISFAEPVTAAQTAWLCSTHLPVRSISFSNDVHGEPPRYDTTCSLLATDARALAHSAGSLVAAKHIIVPHSEGADGDPNPLHGFTALADVTLVMDWGIDEERLTRLPPSVRRITILGDQRLPENDNMVSLQASSLLPCK